MYTIILDIIVLFVLGVTIFFCWKLNNKITELQKNKSEMVGFIKSLDTTIINAHKSIVNLKEAAQNINTERQKYVDEANILTNDLSFMIDSGNRLINRLEKSVESTKVIEGSIEMKIAKYNKYRRHQNKAKHVQPKVHIEQSI